MSPLVIADGLSYSDFYKAQKHTAALLRKLMEDRGIPTDVEGHAIPGTLCYDCVKDPPRSDRGAGCLGGGA